jgi:hypothetical protein
MKITKKRINRHKEMAIEALNSNPECRNNDLELLFQVWENQGLTIDDNIKEEIKHSGVDIKTLFRQRQLIQSQGKFLPTTPEVLKKRRKLAADYSEYYSELQ